MEQPALCQEPHQERVGVVGVVGFSSPPVEPLLATQTHTEKSYNAVAISVKALNAPSLLLAYRAELEDDMSTSRCNRHLSGLTQVRCLGFWKSPMVAQERARWLDLTSLSQGEKTQLFDVPVAPKCLFSPVAATKQKHCEEKKHEGEALQLCFPRKLPPPFSTAPWQTFAQAIARPAYHIPRC